MKQHTVRSYTRRSPVQPDAYGVTHRALIAYVRERKARAAQERLDAALDAIADELTDALEQAMQGEEAG